MFIQQDIIKDRLEPDILTIWEMRVKGDGICDNIGFSHIGSPLNLTNVFITKEMVFSVYKLIRFIDYSHLWTESNEDHFYLIDYYNKRSNNCKVWLHW